MSMLNGVIGRNASVLKNLKGHTSDVNCCDFAPNFTLVTGSSDKTIRIWDWINGSGYVERQQSPLRAHKYQVTCVRVSPQGSMMASASVDGNALLWNLHSLTKLYTMTQVNGDPIRVCSFSPDSTLLVTAGNNGAVCIWDLVHRILIRTLFEHEGTAQGLSFTPDSQFLITACSLEVVKVWHMQDLIDTTTDNSCCPLMRLDNIHDMGVFSIDISKHIDLNEHNPLIRFYHMACGGCNNEIKLWKITARALIKNKNLTQNETAIEFRSVLDGHNSSVTCVRYNNSGELLASSSLDKSVKVWDTKRNICLVTLYGHHRYVNCVGFSKDSNLIVSGSTGSNDKLVIVWDLTGTITEDTELFMPLAVNGNESNLVENTVNNECVLLEKIDDIFEGGVNSCCFHGKDLLATGSGDKYVRLFKTNEENNNIEELTNSPFEGHTYAINHVEFSKDGSKLASSSLDGCTFIWNPLTGEKFLSVPKNSLSIKVCRFSPSGQFIVTGGDDEKAVIWDVESMKKISVLEGHLDTITSACISPDNQILVTVSCNADYRVWLLESFKCIYIKEDAHDGGIQSCDFSENLEPIPNVISTGQSYLLATCGNDSMVKLWRLTVEQGNKEPNDEGLEVKLWRLLQGHGGNVISVRLSPLVGEVVCSTATDRQARLWSVYGGHCLHVLDHDSIVTCCSFSSDCSLLAIGCLDRTLWIWKLPQQLVFQTAIINKLKSHSKSIAEWSTTDVIKWLDEIKMSKIAVNVANARLDGEKLFTLSESEVCSGLDLDDRTTEIMIRELKWLKRIQIQIQKPFNQDVPDEFLCPITHEIMREPVTCSDGFTYERNAIAEWFMSGKFTSPMTNEVLGNTEFSANLELRNEIREFLESFGEAEHICSFD